MQHLSDQLGLLILKDYTYEYSTSDISHQQQKLLSFTISFFFYIPFFWGATVNTPYIVLQYNDMLYKTWKRPSSESPKVLSARGPGSVFTKILRIFLRITLKSKKNSLLRIFLFLE